MPIIVRRDQFQDTADLATMAGQATGNAERYQRQQQFDQNFINQAIHAAEIRSSGPTFFERAHADDASNYADVQNRDYADQVLQERRRVDDNRTQVDLARANASVNTELVREAGKYDLEAAKSRADATDASFKRSQFRAAAQGGPEALNAFLAQEAYATGKSPVSPEFLKIMEGTKGTGPDEQKNISEFQRAAGGAIAGGRAGSVLPYLGEKAPQAFGNGTAPGNAPSSEKALEVMNELQRRSGSMDAPALKTLRDQISSAGIDDNSKAAAIKIVDASLTQRQQMRDVEIHQVYDEAIRRVSETIMKTPEGSQPLAREEQRRRVGTEALKIARQYGISTGEFADWAARQNSQPGN